MANNQNQRIIPVPGSEPGEPTLTDSTVQSRRKQRKNHTETNVATTNRKDQTTATRKIGRKIGRTNNAKVGIKKASEVMHLLIAGESDKNIMEMTTISEGSLNLIRSQFNNLKRQLDNVEVYRKNRANILDALHQRIVEAMSDPERIDSASVKDLGWVAESIHKQSRLERGESTENKAISFRDVTSKDLK